MKRRVATFGVFIGVNIFWMNFSVAGPLQQLYPNLQFQSAGSDFSTFYGTPMTEGATPAESASEWIERHTNDFGIPGLVIKSKPSFTTQNNKFTIFDLVQTVGTKAVEKTLGRLVVKNGAVGAKTNPVVLVSGRFARLPGIPFGKTKFSANQATATLKTLKVSDLNRHIESWQNSEGEKPAQNAILNNLFLDWTRPTSVTLVSDERNIVRQVWKIQATNSDLAHLLSWSFYVDVSTNKIVRLENEVFYDGLAGTVQGNGFAPVEWEVYPDTPAHSVYPVNLERLTVSTDLSVSDDTDFYGQYELLNIPSWPVHVRASLSGPRVKVVDQAQPDEGFDLEIASPGFQNFLFNPNPTSNSPSTANVNAFISTNYIIEFFKSRAGTYTGIDGLLTVNTNINDNCNGYYTNSTTNFFRYGETIPGYGCVNTAYSTVVSHEYGHHWVAQRELAQNAFGEGFSDSAAMLLYNDHIIGREFYVDGRFVRNPTNPVITYPCYNVIHYCGELLGGIWWDIKTNFEQNVPNGRELARQLFVDWGLITAGGSGVTFSAHPLTPPEVLTADDDDGNLANGSPHYELICAAFERHEITCPPRSLVTFQTPALEKFRPNEDLVLEVNILPNITTPVPETAKLYYRLGTSGGWTPHPVALELVNSQTHLYRASIPPQTCLTQVEYYFSVVDDTQQTSTYPNGGALNPFSVKAAFEKRPIYSTNFNEEFSWTVENIPSAISGWSRIQLGSMPTWMPAADYDGSGKAYITGAPNQWLLGRSISTSSTFDFSTFDLVEVSYARAIIDGLNATSLDFNYSADDGATWTSKDYATRGTHGLVWVYKTVGIESPTATSKLQFNAWNTAPNVAATASVDALKIVGWGCVCRPDMDNNGQLNVNDYIAFMNAFGAADPRADINNDHLFNVVDYIEFMNVYAAGC